VPLVQSRMRTAFTVWDPVYLSLIHDLIRRSGFTPRLIVSVAKLGLGVPRIASTRRGSYARTSGIKGIENYTGLRHVLNNCGIAQALALRLQVIVGLALALCRRTPGRIMEKLNL